MPEATPAEEARATVADIALTSPALDPSTDALPAPYTCDGRDSWPTLRWNGAPEGTEEMVLFAMNSQPVEGKLFFDWALAGIDPAPGEIEARQLPPGAVVGRNSWGKVDYSVCPAQGEAETYVFALPCPGRSRNLRLRPLRGARAAGAGEGLRSCGAAQRSAGALAECGDHGGWVLAVAPGVRRQRSGLLDRRSRGRDHCRWRNSLAGLMPRCVVKPLGFPPHDQTDSGRSTR